MGSVGRIEQHGHPGELGSHRDEQLDVLLDYVGRTRGQPSDVSTGTRKAFREAVKHWIGGGNDDDGNRAGGPLRGVARGSPECHDDVDFQPYEIRREAVEAVRAAVRETRLEEEILSLDTAELAHALQECGIPARVGQRLARAQVEVSDAPRP